MWGFGRDNPCKDLALAEVVAIDFERCFVLNKMGAKKMVFLRGFGGCPKRDCFALGQALWAR